MVLCCRYRAQIADLRAVSEATNYLIDWISLPIQFHQIQMNKSSVDDLKARLFGFKEIIFAKHKKFQAKSIDWREDLCGSIAKYLVDSSRR